MQYEVMPFGRERLVTIQGGRLVARRHTVHGLIEADVTGARRLICEYEQRTGEAISFTAFVAHCLGKAVDEHRRVHAYRDWRNRLILFRGSGSEHGDPDPAAGPDRGHAALAAGGEQENACRASPEIRSTQARPERTREFGFKWLGYMPSLAWDIFFWFVFRNPG